MRTHFHAVVERLESSLEGFGHRLKHTTAIKVAAAAFGCATDHQALELAERGDLDVPAAGVVGFDAERGHAIFHDPIADRTFGYAISALPEPSAPFVLIASPYSGLVALDREAQSTLRTLSAVSAKPPTRRLDVAFSRFRTLDGVVTLDDAFELAKAVEAMVFDMTENTILYYDDNRKVIAKAAVEAADYRRIVGELESINHHFKGRLRDIEKAKEPEPKYADFLNWRIDTRDGGLIHAPYKLCRCIEDINGSKIGRHVFIHKSCSTSTRARSYPVRNY